MCVTLRLRWQLPPSERQNHNATRQPVQIAHPNGALSCTLIWLDLSRAVWGVFRFLLSRGWVVSGAATVDHSDIRGLVTA